MLSLEKGMGATPGYNHCLRLRNTLTSAIKGRLHIFPILNCLLFEGMLLHTGMYFFFYKYYFYRWVEAGVSLCGSLCLCALLRGGAHICSSQSVHGRAQPVLYPRMLLVPKQKTDWYSELAEPARTDVRVCNKHKHSIRWTKMKAWQRLSRYCHVRILCMFRASEAQK